MLVIACFTFLIHLTETLTYSLRLAGIRVGKLAIALSLTGAIALISRTSNMIQAPLMGKVIDYAKAHPDYPLIVQMRIVIFAATFGTLAAVLLFPSAVSLSSRVIAQLEISGSIPQMVRASVSLRKLKNASSYLRYPKLEMLSRLRMGGIPKRLMLMNAIVTAIYTIGVLAALLAAAQADESATAASQSSGLINGMATILLTVLIDPQIGLMTDKVIKGERELRVMNKMFGSLMVSRLLGTILAQLLLVPASQWIGWTVSLL